MRISCCLMGGGAILLGGWRLGGGRLWRSKSFFIFSFCLFFCFFTCVGFGFGSFGFYVLLYSLITSRFGLGKKLTDAFDSEKEELDIQLRAVPEIEKRIAELTAAQG